MRVLNAQIPLVCFATRICAKVHLLCLGLPGGRTANVFIIYSLNDILFRNPNKHQRTYPAYMDVSIPYC